MWRFLRQPSKRLTAPTMLFLARTLTIRSKLFYTCGACSDRRYASSDFPLFLLTYIPIFFHFCDLYIHIFVSVTQLTGSVLWAVHRLILQADLPKRSFKDPSQTAKRRIFLFDDLLLYVQVIEDKYGISYSFPSLSLSFQT